MNYILHYKVAQVGNTYSFLDLTNDNVAPVLSDGLTFNQYGIVFGNTANLTITKSSISNYIRENEDYTIYFRYKRNSSSTEDIILTSGNSNSTGEFNIKITSDTKLVYTNAGTEVINVATGISDTSQHHIAISRFQGILRVYVDGVKISEQENNTDQLFTSSNSVIVGSIKNACLDDMTVIKGTALYRYFDFEPPLDLYAPKDTFRSAVMNTGITVVTKREIITSPNLKLDTKRIIRARGAIYFDTKRIPVIDQEEGFNFSTKRIVYLTLNVNFSTKRKIIGAVENIEFDTSRIINRKEKIKEDTKRYIIKEFDIEYDTERKPVIDINIPFDTSRIPGIVSDVPFDTKRLIAQKKRQLLNTERKVLKNIRIEFDTELNTIINITFSDDTERVVGVSPGAVWDTRREVRSWEIPIVAFLFLNDDDIDTLNPDQSGE